MKKLNLNAIDYSAVAYRSKRKEREFTTSFALIFTAMGAMFIFAAYLWLFA